MGPTTGCTPQTLHVRVKREQADHGKRSSVTTDEHGRPEGQEREIDEMRVAEGGKLQLSPVMPRQV